MCLTLISLCPNLEMGENYKKELPKNELQPLCTSSTLSELEPSSAPVSLSKKEVPKSVVDPLYASVPLSLLEPPSASVSYSVVESLSTLQFKISPSTRW